MGKFLRNLLVSLIASIGLFIITVVILEALGIDTGLADICDCGRSCKSGKCSSSANKSGTKIKRNYTEITLPEE